MKVFALNLEWINNEISPCAAAYPAIHYIDGYYGCWEMVSAIEFL